MDLISKSSQASAKHFKVEEAEAIQPTCQDWKVGDLEIRQDDCLTVVQQQVNMTSVRRRILEHQDRETHDG